MNTELEQLTADDRAYWTNRRIIARHDMESLDLWQLRDVIQRALDIEHPEMVRAALIGAIDGHTKANEDRRRRYGNKR